MNNYHIKTVEDVDNYINSKLCPYGWHMDMLDDPDD